MTPPDLGEDEIRRIRRDRLDPRPTQWDYLHLDGLRRGLMDAIRRVDERGARGPVLDLYCGAKPYAPLLPWEPVVGVDIDRHFGGADVVADLPLPLPDASFGVAVCTQALYLVDDPVGAVDELRRVLVEGGHVIVTTLHLFVAEVDDDRRLHTEDLVQLFAGWDDVAVRGVHGLGAALGAALALRVGGYATQMARRWPASRAVITPAVVMLNALAYAMDLVGPLRRRWPHTLVLIARRPARR